MEIDEIDESSTKNVAMRKMLLVLDAGFAGTRTHRAWLIPEDVSNYELEEVAWEQALAHAESYGVYPSDYQIEEEDEEDGDTYTDNIEGYFRSFDEQKDTGKVLYGTNRTIEWEIW